MTTSQTTNELAALKQEFDRLRTRVDELESERNDAIAALADATGLSRRQVIGIITGGAGAGALGLLASERAAADASTTDGDGDVGLPGERVDVFAESVDAGTVDADQVDVNAASVPSSNFVTNLPNSGIIDHRVFNGSVSTSAVTLGSTTRGGIWHVYGNADGDSTTAFLDEVAAIQSGSASDTELTTRGSPVARSYAVDGINLELSMASGTYDVGATGFRLFPGSP